MPREEAIDRGGIKRVFGQTMSFSNGNENTPTVSITMSGRAGRPVGFILRIKQDKNIVDLSLQTMKDIIAWAEK